MISLTDYRTIVFSLKQEKEDFKDLWKLINATPFYLPKNDSIWIWQHDKLKDRYATESELKLDTSGFVIQIISNVLILIIVVWGVAWQTKKWIKLKHKK